MTQASATVLQIDTAGAPQRRSLERQTLFPRINELKAAEADLEGTRRAVSDASDAKWACDRKVGELRKAAEEAGIVPLFDRIMRAVESGVEPSNRFRDQEEEKIATRLKIALQDIDMHSRRITAAEAMIPDMETSVGWARDKVRQAGLAVIRSSAALEAIMDGAETLQNQVTEKRVALGYFLSHDVVSDGDQVEVKRLVRLMDEGIVNWRRHATYITWQDTLARLMADADAELPSA